jgi:Fe2+ or Zn2+ uptake regulation protein
MRPGGHHDHLICSECGKVVDFRNCNVPELEKRLTTETGFVIKEHRLDLYGLCPQCA